MQIGRVSYFNRNQNKGKIRSEKEYFTFDLSSGKQINHGDLVSFEKRGSTAVSISLLETSKQLLDNYMGEVDKGYFISDNNLKEQLIIDYPQKLAELFSLSDRQNKASQIRQFYDFLHEVESRYNLQKNHTIDFIRSELSKVVPLANNRMQRDLITKEFNLFLSKNIEKAKESADNFTNGFIPHFHSLLCYYPKN